MPSPGARPARRCSMTAAKLQRGRMAPVMTSFTAIRSENFSFVWTDLKTLGHSTIQRKNGSHTAVPAPWQTWNHAEFVTLWSPFVLARGWGGVQWESVTCIWMIILITKGKLSCFYTTEARWTMFTVPACSIARSCPTLCDPMDCNPPGSSPHGISQARIQVLPFPSPGDLPNPAIERRLLHRQTNSLPLKHQGSPCTIAKVNEKLQQEKWGRVGWAAWLRSQALRDWFRALHQVNNLNSCGVNQEQRKHRGVLEEASIGINHLQKWGLWVALFIF